MSKCPNPLRGFGHLDVVGLDRALRSTKLALLYALSKTA